jgi:hypothetical protein
MNDTSKDLSVTAAPRHQRPLSQWERAGMAAKESRFRIPTAPKTGDKAGQGATGTVAA